MKDFPDEGYRWREDEVDVLPSDQVRALLLHDAHEEAEHNEHEVAYQILPELL